MKLKFLVPACLLFGLVLSARPQSAATTSPATASHASAEGGYRDSPVAALRAEQPEEKRDPAEDLKKPSTMVGKIGHMLGMSPAAAKDAFDWLNFLILAVAVGYALAKALPKLFRTRTEGIQKHIVDARTATETANARLSAVEARLAKLDDEIAAIRSDSERESAEEDERMQQQMAAETERILKSAEQEIAAAQSQAERNLRAYAAGIAVDRAAGRLTISDEDDRALIQNFAAKLGQGSVN